MTSRKIWSFVVTPAGIALAAAMALATVVASGENPSASAPRSMPSSRRRNCRTTDSARLDVDCRPAHGRAPLPLLRLRGTPDRSRDRSPRGAHDVHGDGLHHLR